jgi:hypothetical protein
VGIGELILFLIGMPLYGSVLIAVVGLGVVLGNFACAYLEPQLAQVRSAAWERWRSGRSAGSAKP